MGKFVTSMITSAGYTGVILLMFLENVFPPIPSEVIMPLSGYLVLEGQLTLPLVVAAGTVGSIAGALPLYYLGRHYGEERLKRFANDHCRVLTISGRDIESAKRWFDKYGPAAVLLCRLVPGVRSMISIPAGIGKMSLASFLFFSTIGMGVWTAALAYLGYFLGRNFEVIGEYLDPITWALLGGLAAAYLFRFVRHNKGGDC